MSQDKKEITYVDVNTAEIEDMARVPRINRSLAEAIAAGRPYKKMEDLLKVRGMGEKSLAQLKPYLKISPLDVNRASVDELMTLERFPRLLAERIVEGRPYANLEAVRKVRGMGPRLYDQYAPYLYAGEVEGMQPVPEIKTPMPEIEEAPQEAVIDAVVATPPASASTPTLPVSEKTVEEPQPEPIIAVGPTTATQAVFYPPVEPAPGKQAEAAAEMPAEGAETGRAGGFFKSPGWNRAIQIIAPDVPPFSSEEHAQPSARPNRSEILLWAAGTGLIVLFLSIALNLGLMAIINGGLRYAPNRDLLALQSQVTLLDSQARTLQQDVDGLRTRLDNMETLSGRIGTLEEEQAGLQQDIDAASQQVQAMQEQVDAVGQQVSDIEQRTTAFEQFLNGLSSLLQNIWPGTTP